MLALIYYDKHVNPGEKMGLLVKHLEKASISCVVLVDKRSLGEAVNRCDIIISLDNPAEIGLVMERHFPKLPVPVYGYGDIMEREPAELETYLKSWTELHAPLQTRSFMEHIMEMYRIHLAKNHDYSPANITGPGMIGIATRMWDKIVRIMNLTGFSITAEHLGFEKPRRAVNEPYMDAFKDVAVYGVIAQIFQEGKWGK